MSLKPPLPVKAPACFDTPHQWNLYRRLASYLRSARKLSPKFTYCTDCTPEYRDKMCAEKRCKFPGTTFKIVNGVTVGQRETRQRDR
jgi:hypothetical protein